MGAAGNGCAGCVRALIAAGADVNAQDNRGATALKCAHRHPAIAALLRAAGAK
jgi:ankyrin repeat protein